jgi:hypothetical protein
MRLPFCSFQGNFIMAAAQKDWVSKTELEKYGIVTVPLQVFLWGGYRYTNARVALAAAKRADPR